MLHKAREHPANATNSVFLQTVDLRRRHAKRLRHCLRSCATDRHTLEHKALPRRQALHRSAEHADKRMMLREFRN